VCFADDVPIFMGKHTTIHFTLTPVFPFVVVHKKELHQFPAFLINFSGKRSILQQYKTILYITELTSSSVPAKENPLALSETSGSPKNLIGKFPKSKHSSGPFHSKQWLKFLKNIFKFLQGLTLSLIWHSSC